MEKGKNGEMDLRSPLLLFSFTPFFMFKNYFSIGHFVKIAYRNLLKNKGYSVINILGLSLGMTCTILIAVWINNELTFDHIHQNRKEIFKVLANRTFNNQTFTDENMVLPLASALEKNSALVKNAVVMTSSQSRVLVYNEKKMKKEGYRVSEHFFNMFTWKTIKGNPGSMFLDPNSIILTHSTADAIFGNEDPINKIIRLPNNNADVKVIAVVEDISENSTILFDYVMPFNYTDAGTIRSMANWTNSSWRVFVQTQPGSITELENQINQIKYDHDAKDKAISKYFLFPMEKLHLYGEFKDGKNVGGLITYVKLFSIISIFILLIACINFMNLSTAGSEKRSKEVGIRKAIGSAKHQLILQFFSESIFLVLISFIISILTTMALLPAFNRLIEKNISIDFSNPYSWIVSLMIISITGLIAGSYPSLYLSSFNPIQVLKGTIKAGKNAILPRRILVVGQFSISIIFRKKYGSKSSGDFPNTI